MQTDVLSVHRDGVKLPIAFFSQQLTKSEKNYSATDLEGFAVVSTVQHFEIYITGEKITIETDHRALSYLQSAKQLSERL